MRLGTINAQAEGAGRFFSCTPATWRTRGLGQRPKVLEAKKRPEGAAFTPPHGGLRGWFVFGVVLGSFSAPEKELRRDSPQTRINAGSGFQNRIVGLSDVRLGSLKKWLDFERPRIIK